MRARKKPNVMERGSVPCFSVFFRPNHESAPVALLQSLETEDYFYQVVRYVERKSLRANLGAEIPACKPRGASGIAALVEFAPCEARRHGVPHPLGVAFASPHRLAATCQPAANGSRSGGVAVLRQSRSALRRSQLGHRHGRAIGAGMDDSASWKTEETIIRLATVTCILKIWWLSPFTFWWLSPFTFPHLPGGAITVAENYSRR